MNREPNRLSFRIPWFAHLAAEGTFAIIAMLVLVVLAIFAAWLLG